jgi:PhnB protein
MRFKEAPEGGCAPGQEDNVMHSEFKVGDTVLMATDGMGRGAANFDGISLALNASNDAEAEKYFNNLAEGGQVNMPLAETFFASKFGMVQDKFGVHWLVVTPPAGAGA